MSLIKRQIELKQNGFQRRTNGEPDEALWKKVEDLLFMIRGAGTRKSQEYKLLRENLTREGYRPFDIMTTYQAILLTEKDPTLPKREAWESGRRIAAYIAQRKRG